VGDVHERLAGLGPDAEELVLHHAAGLGIEGREGLVEQEDLRIVGERPGQGHALAHAARQLVRVALLGAAQVHQLDQAARALLALAARHPAHLGPEGDVSEHGAPREERVVLEHHAGELAVAARGGRKSIAPEDGASRPAMICSRVGLAAAGGPQQDEELARRDVEGDGLERGHPLPGARDVPGLADVAEGQQHGGRRPRYSRNERSTTRSIGTGSFTQPIWWNQSWNAARSCTRGLPLGSR
jgi:hypothetical protein